MRRWIHERVDDLMFPALKAISWGYRRRMPAYRPCDACEIESLSDVGVPAEVELREQRPWRGCRVQRYQFASPVDCCPPGDELVSGALITVDPEAPWTLIVPGYGTGAVLPASYSIFQELQGRVLVERGINVALIDLPYHLARRREGAVSGEGFFSPDLQATKLAVRQAASDSTAVVRWLEHLHGRPVGLWGTSLGGCIAGLVTTQVDTLGAVVLMEPLDNPGAPMAVLPGSADIRAAVARAGISPAEIAQALLDVAPSTYPPAVPLDRLLFITPLWDRVVPARFQEAFWASWGRPERIVEDAGHVMLTKDWAIARRAAEFIARRIKGSVQ